MRKKTIFFIYLLLLIGVFLVFSRSSCKKEEPSVMPTLITAAVTSITTTTAICGGIIIDDGGASVTARGVCWSTSQNPTITDNFTTDSSGMGIFTSSLSGLTASTKYYVKAYATNSIGTAYGNERPLTTSEKVTDIDGNVYNTVIIGTQVWMKENLKTTKYNDETAIPLVTDDSAWSVLTTPAYCWYNNNSANKDTYGALYNWYTVNTNILCPAGWHVPTDADWTTLTTYLGGESIAGGKLKENGTAHWNSPNKGATNETGFTALPGGWRSGDGRFVLIGSLGDWWSASEGDANSAYDRSMWSDRSNLNSNYDSKNNGFSVRCIRD